MRLARAALQAFAGLAAVLRRVCVLAHVVGLVRALETSELLVAVQRLEDLRDVDVHRAVVHAVAGSISAPARRGRAPRAPSR